MISIVIPTYNEERHLPKLLESIKNQVFKDYEVIVADAGSKDNTTKIAKKYKCRIVKGGNPAFGRNRGAEAAKGEFLLFLDADIVIKDKSFLEQIMRIKNLNQKENQLITFFIYPDSKEMIHRIFFTIKNYANYISNYIIPHVNGQCVFIEKKMFEKIKGYDETLYLGEEHDLAQRARKFGIKIAFLKAEIECSPRRIIKEGFTKLMLKSILSEIYRTFFGKIKKPIIPYDFEYL